MQAMAPGSSSAPQEGHSLGVSEVAVAPPGAGREGTTGAATGTGRGLAARAAAIGCGAGAAAGTWNGFWHDGQRTPFPAALSGTCIALLQCGQRMT